MKLLQHTISTMAVCAIVCFTPLCTGQGESTPSSATPPAATQSTPAPQANAPGPVAAPAVDTARPAASPAPTNVPAAKAGTDAPAAADPKPSRPQTGARSSYIIGPLDVIDVRVWNQPQLSSAMAVGPDGIISMPLIGEVKADGLTTGQLKEVLQTRLTEFLNNPEVDVTIGKINSKRCFVYGEVLRPGPFSLVETTTIMDVISEVGFKEFANPKKITIQRGDQTFHFNYEDFRKGKNKEKNVNIVIQNGDRVYVP